MNEYVIEYYTTEQRDKGLMFPNEEYYKFTTVADDDVSAINNLISFHNNVFRIRSVTLTIKSKTYY